MALTNVYSITAYVPFYQGGQGINLDTAADGVTVTNAYTNFVQTCQTNSIGNTAYEQELHTHDWQIMSHRLEFVALPASVAALQAAASTFQTALNNQNPGVIVNLEVHTTAAQRGW